MAEVGSGTASISAATRRHENPWVSAFQKDRGECKMGLGTSYPSKRPMEVSRTTALFR